MKRKVKKGTFIPLSSKAMLLEVYVYNKLFKNLFTKKIPIHLYGENINHKVAGSNPTVARN